MIPIKRLEQLKIFLEKELKHHYSYYRKASDFTYTKTGGYIDCVIQPTTVEEALKAITFLRTHQYPYFVLGNGSNILLPEEKFNGIVVNFNKMDAVIREDNLLVADAGAKIIDVSQEALSHSLTGMEFACGIPGSVGGAIYMNAGAYEGEVSFVLRKVLVIDENNQLAYRTTDECEFNYRSSVFQKNGDIILKGYFELSLGDKQIIEEKMKHLTQLRTTNQPLEFPSCGSVFKRPKGFYVGQLVQEANLKGYRIGGVEVSKKHGGFMVNVDGGTSQDYVDLIKHVQQEIYNQFQVKLEPEVRIIKPFKEPLC